MKLRITLLLVVFFAANASFGQYYYLTGSGVPGNLNTDDAYPSGGGQPAGWNNFLGPAISNPTWSASQTIPFNFNFNGSPVSSYFASSTGVVTFSTNPGSAPTTANANLPSASIPNGSLCLWGLETSGTNDVVTSKTFGTAPNRQHWIQYNSCVNGAMTWSYYSIVLEESTNKIYFVDQRTTTGTGSLTIGIQIDGSTAYEVSGSPNIGAMSGSNIDSSDDFYWEFIPGIQSQNDVSIVSSNILAYSLAGNITIGGTIQNLGSVPITSLEISWDAGSGPNTQTFGGLNIATNDTYNFVHGTPLNTSLGMSYYIDIIANLSGDSDLGNNSLSATTTILSQFPEKVVVGEEKTGTWCGFCPRGSVALSGMESEANFIGIAVHNNDPMIVFSYDSEIGNYALGGYPGATVDRVLDGDPSSFSSMFNQRINAIAPCSVKTISAEFDPANNQILVASEVEFYGNIPGDYRLSCVITEDGVTGIDSIWYQNNYYDGGSYGVLTDPVTSFEWSTAGSPVNPVDFGGYNHVARSLSNDDILGDIGSLPTGVVPMGTYSYSFAPLSSTVIDDYNNSHAIVMIVNSLTGEIINAGKADLSIAEIKELKEITDFQLNPNPAKDVVFIDFELTTASDVSITVTNVNSNTFFKENLSLLTPGKHSKIIETRMLESGLYFITVHCDNNSVTKKLIVTK